MSDMNPFANVVRRVNRDKKFFIGEPVCDEQRMMTEQFNHKKAMAQDEYNNQVMEAQLLKNKEQQRFNDITRTTILESLKTQYINRLAKELPTYLLGECFASVYTRSLPHNKFYVLEHNGQFNQLAHLYINKIGGFDHLKKVAATTESTYLKKLANYISEASKDIVAKKTDQVKKAITEDEIRDMLNPMVDPKEKNKLLAKVDTLGSDELAELVNQKVLDVVNDERRKIKHDTEFKNLLKNDLDSDMSLDDGKATDTEDIDGKSDMYSDDEGKKDIDKNKTLAKDVGFGSSSKGESNHSGKGSKDELSMDKNLKTQEGGKDTATKESTMQMSFMEAFEKWDPVNGTFDYNPNKERRSLFTSMMENCMTGLILGAAGKTRKRRPSKVLYESPINLTAIEDMIATPKDEFATESASTTDMSSENINKSRILSEVLSQYALIECAHTMKLINVTPVDVARQCEFLVTEYA